MGLLAGSNELIEIKCLAQCRVHSKGSIKGNYCLGFFVVVVVVTILSIPEMFANLQKVVDSKIFPMYFSGSQR